MSGGSHFAPFGYGSNLNHRGTGFSPVCIYQGSILGLTVLLTHTDFKDQQTSVGIAAEATWARAHARASKALGLDSAGRAFLFPLSDKARFSLQVRSKKLVPRCQWHSSACCVCINQPRRGGFLVYWPLLSALHGTSPVFHFRIPRGGLEVAEAFSDRNRQPSRCFFPSCFNVGC